MFVDQIEYRDEWYDGEFTLADLDEEFYKKVIGIYYSHSSGIGGPGTLRFITEECVQYEIGMDMMSDDEFHCGAGGELSDIETAIPLLQREEYDKGKYMADIRGKYLIESKGWTYKEMFAGYRLIRNDYVEIDEYEDFPYEDLEYERKEILYPFAKIGRYLMRIRKEPKTYIYKGTKDYRIYLMEEWDKYTASKDAAENPSE